jgi:type IV pilus assembly protein PilY1
MERISSLFLAGFILGVSSSAAAQSSPDMRNVRPIVMLLVDTSGSMESETGQPSRTYPSCRGIAGSDERSRYTTILEALTGSWSSFTCAAVSRSSFAGQPDQFYPVPYHQPPILQAQQSDGILDAYLDRAKFGLMTADNVFGLMPRAGDPESYAFMVPSAVFTARLSSNATTEGDFSYGTPRPLTFPGCATPYMVDAGAHSASSPRGALISVGSDADDYRAINGSIQTQLMNLRPFGPSSTAGMLDDFRFYLANHPDVRPPAGGVGDTFASCRSRYAIVLTDGQPNDPWRETMGCGTGGNQCPYDLPTTIAADLCRYNAGTRECDGAVDGIFVVGFDVSDPVAQAALNDLADRGGTGSAYMATSLTALRSALSTVLDRAAPGTATRTAPVFAASRSTGSGPQTQYQFNSGFELPRTAGAPWAGVLDRTRWVCDASLVPQRQPLDPARDSFDDILNARDVASQPRVLYTVATPSRNDMVGTIVGRAGTIAPIGGGGGGGVVSGMALTRFETANTALTAGHFGLSGGSPTTLDARRRAIIDWVHGAAGTTRAGNRFGDIYHSTPVVVGPPRADLADESFNLFRRRPDVQSRPTVVYVGTNDGILHCFATEDMTVGTRTLRAGEEIWGFVPPAIVPRLDAATTSHQILVDGVPVVRDVFYMRRPGDAPTASPTSSAAYRTVLVMGLRGGGRHYFALDVTNPLQPEFLWQYTEGDMGFTYARPAVGQVLVEIGGQMQERAIALLPGGNGAVDDAMARTTGPVGCPAQGVGTPPVTGGTTNARSRQRCWGRTGRSLSWVDIVTGETLFRFDHRTFNAPLTGGVSFFSGEVGTVATRAFLTDADGVMWRIDFASRRSSDWTALPFHDIFWDAGATVGQPAYEPPVISTDLSGNLVVLQGTGDIDSLDSTASNRVVSLTERVTPSTTGPSTFTTDLNWEIRLRPGEQLTGPIDLFDGVAYFGTFESQSGTNPCDYGQSRIWGVEYRSGGGTAPLGYSTGVAGRYPRPRLESVEGSGTFDAHFVGPYLNTIVMGVGVTQQISCTQGTEVIDPYIGTRYRVTNSGGGAFQLVAQMSGAAGSTSGTSSVRTFSRTLPAPVSYTRVFSWVPQADF